MATNNFKNNFRCSELYCYENSDEHNEILSICDKKTYFCFKHCTDPSHYSHCINMYCDINKKSKICEETSLCAEHCMSPSHFHCAHFDCDEVSEVCSDKSLCFRHCVTTGHTHCKEFLCALPNANLSTSSACMPCEEHFNWIMTVVNFM